ncbi:MAG: phosphoadenylyl-sulfate reductase [Acidobacteria bacterium]|nr:phosphoadenylyl-sulfate reductase [Acidobacteriota bacterium]
MKQFTALEVKALNAQFEGSPPEDLLGFASTSFGQALAFACSMGMEDAVLLEMASHLDLKPRVFFLDTGRLHSETYDTLARLQVRYGMRIETYAPDAAALEAFVNARGINAFYESLEDRKACCAIRKVEPLGRALRGAGAWITGLRREQAPTRSGLAPFEVDWEHGGILKVNPLINWTFAEVHAYAISREIPINPLHAIGYPSIGCAPCTRPILEGEDMRAGRWWWESPEHKECGLHAAKKVPA